MNNDIYQNQSSIFRRLLAFFIDLIFIFIFARVIYYFFSYSFSNYIGACLIKYNLIIVDLLQNINFKTIIEIVGSIFSVLICIYIYGIVEGISGISLGKLFLAIRIVDINSSKKNINKLFFRYILKYSIFPSLILLVPFINLSIYFKIILNIYIWLYVFSSLFFLFKNKQTIYDKILKTIVLLKTKD